MKETILARRYARALFSLGQENGESEKYSESLAAIAELYHEDTILDALVNPMYPLEIRQNVMEKIGESAGGDSILIRFLTLLVEKKRAVILPEIAIAIQAMVDEEQNICHGSVVSAVELNEELKGKVRETLEKITGKTVMLETSVDPSIIGGIVAKVGDLVLDGSIKAQLHGLKEAIKGRE